MDKRVFLYFFVTTIALFGCQKSDNTEIAKNSETLSDLAHRLLNHPLSSLGKGAVKNHIVGDSHWQYSSGKVYVGGWNDDSLIIESVGQECRGSGNLQIGSAFNGIECDLDLKTKLQLLVTERPANFREYCYSIETDPAQNISYYVDLENSAISNGGDVSYQTLKSLHLFLEAQSLGSCNLKVREVAKEKAKTEELEKNSWYTIYNFLGGNYSCKKSNKNPGEGLISAQLVDFSAYISDEKKEGDKIIMATLNLKGGYIYYMRGKGFCEARIARLNNEQKAFSDKYK